MLEARQRALVDWPLLAAVVALAAIGVVLVRSATLADPNESELYLRQLVYLAVGAVFLLVVTSLEYRLWLSLAWPLYLVTTGMLVYVALFGRPIAGARSWIELGAFNLQPSETAKVTTLMLLAALLGERTRRGGPERGRLLPTVVAVVPMALTAAQPDLGTAMTFLPLVVMPYAVRRLRWRWLAGGALVVALAAPLVWSYALAGYQQERILSFIDPSRDPRGSGYQTIQSKIAVGSGGMMGKGLFSGTQSQLDFLPEQHTDFIFAVLAEETGFAGVAVTLLLYLIVFRRSVGAALVARDVQGSILAGGAAGLLLLHVVYNVGMVVGLIPIAGIPLPLLSYGGSSAIATMTLVGLVLNVRMRRFAN